MSFLERFKGRGEVIGKEGVQSVLLNSRDSQPINFQYSGIQRYQKKNSADEQLFQNYQQKKFNSEKNYNDFPQQTKNNSNNRQLNQEVGSSIQLKGRQSREPLQSKDEPSAIRRSQSERQVGQEKFSQLQYNQGNVMKQIHKIHQEKFQNSPTNMIDQTKSYQRQFKSFNDVYQESMSEKPSKSVNRVGSLANAGSHVIYYSDQDWTPKLMMKSQEINSLNYQQNNRDLMFWTKLNDQQKGDLQEIINKKQFYNGNRKYDLFSSAEDSKNTTKNSNLSSFSNYQYQNVQPYNSNRNLNFQSPQQYNQDQDPSKKQGFRFRDLDQNYSAIHNNAKNILKQPYQ